MIPGIASRASDTNLSWRSFLSASVAVGGGLMLSLSLPLARSEAAHPESFAPNAFIRIGSDGKVVLTMPYVEMGQGTYTSIPMLIAEELDVTLKQVRLEHAPPNEKLYANPMLGVLDWKFECDARCMEAAARGRGDRSDHAGRGGGQTLGRRCNIVPRTGWRGNPRADRSSPELRRAGRRCSKDARPRKCHPEVIGRFQADRHAGQAA
jgi:hypothetical protein